MSPEILARPHPGRRPGVAARMAALLGRRVVTGVLIVSVALAVEYGAQFARSLVLTRMLGPVEFGLASSIAILASLVAMSTSLGPGRYLIQAKDGGGAEALAVAHALAIGSGVLSSILLLGLAWPTALMLGAPQDVGAFLWLAAIPLIRGFDHLRVEQVQRDHRFWPASASGITENLAGLIAVTCAAVALQDHRAVLFGLGAQAAASVCASQALARAPYRISFAAIPAARALRFGLPLMLNGLALAALGHLDRLAVGGLLGLAELGRYTLATMIFYLPASLLFRVVTSIAQPRLSAAWHESPRAGFPRLFRRMNVAASIGAALAAGVVAMLGDALLTTVFGGDFGTGDVFFAVFSLAVFMRFAKQSANIGGICMGRTKDLMLSNLSGAAGIAVTIIGLLLMRSLWVAAAGLLAGETIGAATAFLRLDRHLRASGCPPYTAFAVSLPVPCIAAIWVLLADPTRQERLGAVAALILSSAAAAWMISKRNASVAAGIRS